MEPPDLIRGPTLFLHEAPRATARGLGRMEPAVDLCFTDLIHGLIREPAGLGFGGWGFANMAGEASGLRDQPGGGPAPGWRLPLHAGGFPAVPAGGTAIGSGGFERLVPVSFADCSASISGLSTWWSSTALDETWF